MLTPLSIRARASSLKRTSLAAMEIASSYLSFPRQAGTQFSLERRAERGSPLARG
jgi:hypothetical protein